MSTQHIAHVWPGKKDVAAFLVTFITTHTVHLEMASTLKKSELMSFLDLLNGFKARQTRGILRKTFISFLSIAGLERFVVMSPLSCLK